MTTTAGIYLGNPYPSSLDWNFVDLLNVNPSVAVWDGTNLLGQLQPGYRYYNKNTGVGIFETFNGIIFLENGFFVSATGISASITMPGYARVHSSTPLFKVTKTDLLRLHVEGNSLQDEMIIHFNNDATPGFDDFDGKKIESEINLYSIVDGYRFWLNTIPLESNDYVSIGFSASLPGNYDLFASGFESFKVSTPLFLEDLKTNKIYDLNQDSKYTFYYDINDNAQRFRLYFSNCPDMQNEATNGISIYSSENLVYIINKSQISGEYWIHDIGGREVLHGTLSNQYKTCIPLKVSAGTYLVKVVNNQGLSFKKISIR
ncbi:MAG: T9SS type A sorting domain-containing protein [Bacteroidales bacterium]|nr:T9SS type A sorting domain-containing protein [Bacteroidales bacterium]